MLLDNSLIEGLHYSIMFYGGRLLRHLTANDPEVNDFISLRRLNRNVVVVIDSDRKTIDDTINSTKTRIVTELTSSAGFCWVTAGRQIENYVTHSVLEAAIRAAHPTTKDVQVGNQFDDPLLRIQ